ncbi:MAG: DUF3047 domain-containing protein [Proteobacteria bacterium]|nr:DUF3047 domain-containing protein [Pseudomonadota bacterium]
MKRAVLLFLTIIFWHINLDATVFSVFLPMEVKEWKIKEFKGKANYKLVDSPKKLIKLVSEESSFNLVRDFILDISEYRFLNFEWMVEVLPEGGDARFKNKDDQPAQLYVIAPSFPEMINYKAIGYIWDSKCPPGDYQSPKISNIKYVVLKSGGNDINKLIKEKVNVYEDFKRLWGIELKKRKIVIALGIDSDDTKSKAVSYFGDIYFSKD